MKSYPLDKKQLLYVADGPESIEIFTSEENAIVDMGADIPGLYVQVTINGASARVGPFQLRTIREAVERALQGGA